MTPADLDKVREALKRYREIWLTTGDRWDGDEWTVTIKDIRIAIEALALLAAEQHRPEAETMADIHAAQLARPRLTPVRQQQIDDLRSDYAAATLQIAHEKERHEHWLAQARELEEGCRTLTIERDEAKAALNKVDEAMDTALNTIEAGYRPDWAWLRALQLELCEAAVAGAGIATERDALRQEISALKAGLSWIASLDDKIDLNAGPAIRCARALVSGPQK